MVNTIMLYSYEKSHNIKNKLLFYFIFNLLVWTENVFKKSLKNKALGVNVQTK
jgi:hypothetical protein